MTVPDTGRDRACLVCAVLSVFLVVDYSPGINGYVPRVTQPPRCPSTLRRTPPLCAALPTRTPNVAAASATSDDTSGAERESLRRRRRRNKYADFSKVEALEMDPLERLVADSIEKNRVLDEQRRLQRSSMALRRGGVDGGRTGVFQYDESTPPGAEGSQVASMSFPDNKDIDPYDPTTFGYVAVGSITAAHGVHGWVKVQSVAATSAVASSSNASGSSSASPLARSGTRLHVKLPRKRAPRAVRLVSGRHCANDEYLCLLEGVITRDDALGLRGAVLYTRQEDDAQQQTTANDGDDTYFVSELVGLAVYAYDEARSSASAELDNISNQAVVGSVGGVVFGDDISDLPLGYDLLEVIVAREPSHLAVGGKRKPEERVLIPLVPQLVPVIDTTRGFVLIDPPSGLLDLRYIREEKVKIKGLLPPSSSSTTM